MARPRTENPTPAELEVLQIIWERGPSTIREVMTVLQDARRRAYTSLISLMGVMSQKGLLSRKPKGQALVYRATSTRRKTLSAMVADLLARAFDGSASAMVAHLREQVKPSGDELEEIRKAIAIYRQEWG